MSDTDDAPGDGTADSAVTVSDRDHVLALLDDAIQEAHRKVTNGRVREAENEKVRCQWIRTLAYAVNSYRQLKRDTDLDELDARLSAIERAYPEGDDSLRGRAVPHGPVPLAGDGGTSRPEDGDRDGDGR